MCPAPILFEDAREQLYWEQVEQGLWRLTKELRESKVSARVEAHVRWRSHWRTKLSCFLCRLAERIELPEPPDLRKEEI